MMYNNNDGDASPLEPFTYMDWDEPLGSGKFVLVLCKLFYFLVEFEAVSQVAMSMLNVPVCY